MLMAKTATMTIRLDPDIKSKVERVYSRYGMTLTEAVNVFFHQSLNVEGLPFDLRPNPETLAALEEVKDMEKHPERYKGYHNVQDMIDGILSEAD